jgi:hypothetical protein
MRRGRALLPPRLRCPLPVVEQGPQQRPPAAGCILDVDATRQYKQKMCVPPAHVGLWQRLPIVSETGKLHTFWVAQGMSSEPSCAPVAEDM